MELINLTQYLIGGGCIQEYFSLRWKKEKEIRGGGNKIVSNQQKTKETAKGKSHMLRMRSVAQD